jgi:hypothetical protein
MKPDLLARLQGGGIIRTEAPDRWHMELPAGPGGVYRWAQFDDYMGKARRRFFWRLGQQRAALRLELQARVSAQEIPGTWGFGFWNDPFSLGTGIGGTSAHLPALPNAAWFFYAAPPNYLAFRDTHPAQGFLAATFASPRIPTLALAPAALALPLLAVRPAARWLRRAAARLIGEDSRSIQTDVTQWHAYRLDWEQRRAVFAVDGEVVFTTPLAPGGPLGLVLWIDNQYAAFPPTGKLSMGTLPNPAPAWLEIEGLAVETIAVEDPE